MVAINRNPWSRSSGTRSHLRRLVRRIRQRWPATRILIRGDSHYGRAEVMQWCEDNGIDYVFGLAVASVFDLHNIGPSGVRIIDGCWDDDQ